MYLEIRTADSKWSAIAESWVSSASWPAGDGHMTVHAVQSEWSGAVMELMDGVPLPAVRGLTKVPFQYPGMLGYDPDLQRYILCYGEGRWQDGYGPRPTIPVGRVIGDLRDLQRFGHSLQFVGSQALTVALVDQVDDSFPANSDDVGRWVEFSLARQIASAILLEQTSPRTTSALAKLLPLFGKATNTYSSGPLTRFWNDNGGPEGGTPLEDDHISADSAALSPSVAKVDRRCSLAAPGYVYYMTSRPWWGLRIAAREATVMKSALPGGDRSALVPIARLDGDWAAFAEVAANLRFTGALPMSIQFPA